MTRQIQRRQALNQPVSHVPASQVLDNLFALDRTVIEVSMRTYRVPPRLRSIMRAENRRLHRALRRIRLTGRAFA